MTLLRYVLIGIIGVLLVACESGEKNQKNENSSKNEVSKSIENKQVVSPEKDQKVVKEVSVSGTFKGSPITLTLGKTTFDQVYKTNKFTLHSPSIAVPLEAWKELRGGYRFKIPNVGEFDHIFLDFNENGVLVFIGLEFNRNSINTSFLKDALAIKYNKVPNDTLYEYQYASGNGATILLEIGSKSYDSLIYMLDAFLEKQPDSVLEELKAAASSL